MKMFNSQLRHETSLHSSSFLQLGWNPNLFYFYSYSASCSNTVESSYTTVPQPGSRGTSLGLPQEMWNKDIKIFKTREILPICLQTPQEVFVRQLAIVA
jgi:hypothetical protein